MAGRNKRASVSALSTPSHATPRVEASRAIPMELRDNGLWTKVRFTPRAAEMVRAGEYRYTSPVWLLNRPDPVTGEKVPARFHSVALTNTPFQDGLEPVTVDEKGEAWIHVAKEGHWKGHPSGEFKIERSHMEAAMAEAAKRKSAIVLDYEHKSIKADGPNPAAGWIELSESVEMDDKELLGNLSAILGFEGEVNADVLLEKIKELVNAASPKEEPKKESEPKAEADKPKDEPKEAAMSIDASDPVEVELHAALDKLGEMLGLDAAGVAKFVADNLEALAAVGAPKEEAPEEEAPMPEAAAMSDHPAFTIALSQIAELRSKVDSLAKVEVDRAVDAAIETGIVHESQRVALSDLYVNDRKAFVALTSAAVPVPTGRQATVAMSDSDASFTEKERNAISLMTRGGAMSKKEAERIIINARRK